jgi:hypothetical protein
VRVLGTDNILRAAEVQIRISLKAVSTDKGYFHGLDILFEQDRMLNAVVANHSMAKWTLTRFYFTIRLIAVTARSLLIPHY